MSDELKLDLGNPQVKAILEAEFPAEWIEWKPTATTKDGSKALVAPFCDPRHYQERLSQVDPNWTSEMEFVVPNGTIIKARVTVLGVTREEVGEKGTSDANTVTSTWAMAFKRACASFGIGRYLYYSEGVWVDYDSQKKKVLNPPKGVRMAKTAYAEDEPTGMLAAVQALSPNAVVTAVAPEPAQPADNGVKAFREAGERALSQPDTSADAITEARKVYKTSDGQLLSDLPTEQVLFKLNSLVRAKNPTPEQKFKLQVYKQEHQARIAAHAAA